MRTLRLARIVAEAEGLRLRRHARRLAIQAVMGLVAVVFVISALALLHLTGWLALRRPLGPVWGALVVFGVDVVLAIIFGVLAMRSSPDRIEAQATQVRDQARQQLAITAATTMAVAPVARMLGLRSVSGLLVGALATRFLSSKR